MWRRASCAFPGGERKRKSAARLRSFAPARKPRAYLVVVVRNASAVVGAVFALQCWITKPAARCPDFACHVLDRTEHGACDAGLNRGGK